MWIANSGVVDVPCPEGGLSTSGTEGSVTLIRADGAAKGKAFTGGGLTIPWGVAVDGNDNVWVANFGGKRLSEFCGMHTSSCPRGVRTGGAITPPSGYGFNGLVRNTGVQVDPSGNVWLANNWKTLPIPTANPGGYQLVVYIGLAGPLRTPLIGPPHHL
jgi:sugar lactone lactonase YvrE